MTFIQLTVVMSMVGILYTLPRAMRLHEFGSFVWWVIACITTDALIIYWVWVTGNDSVLF